MPFSQQDLLLGVALPTIVAAIVSLLVRVVPWHEAYQRQAAGFAVGGAFFLGCRLIGLSDWLPTQPWMWFPYVVLAGALCGPLTVAPGVSWFERVIFYAVLSTIAAWMLVPTWSSLEPSRWIWWVGTAAVMTVVGLGIEFLATRERGLRLPLMLFVLITLSSVLVMLAGSARFAQFLMAISGALAGCALTGWVKSRDGTFSGAGLATSFALVGMLMTAKVNSFTKIPFASYAVLAACPLLLAMAMLLLGSKWQGWKGWLLSVLVVVACSGVSLTLAITYDPGVIKFE